MAHTRHSTPDSGLGFQIQSIELFTLGAEVVPSILESSELVLAAFKRGGNNIKGFKDLYLKASAFFNTNQLHLHVPIAIQVSIFFVY